MDVELRGYKAEDVEAMYQLDVECFAPEFRFSGLMMRRFAEARKARVVVAEMDGAMVGFGILHLERKQVGYVVTLDVSPTVRRQGIARRLMEAMERAASAAGCGVVGLHVFVHNDVAVKFYEAEGYERVGVAAGFYGVGLDALMYRKALASVGG